MRFTREYKIDLLTFFSFETFLQKLRRKHQEEQIIGYRTIRNLETDEVTAIVTFYKKE